MQAFLNAVRIVNVHFGKRGHPHDGIHGRAYIMAHCREKIAFCATGFSRYIQGPVLSLLCCRLCGQHIRHIDPHQADGFFMVLIAPQNVDLLVSQKPLPPGMAVQNQIRLAFRSVALLVFQGGINFAASWSVAIS